jgi:hypothetical protein
LCDVEEDGVLASAVAGDGRCRDVRRQVAREERDCPADRGDVGHPAERNAALDLGDGLVAAVWSAVPGVLTSPTSTALTWTPGPHFMASDAVIASRPAFAAPYAAVLGDGRVAETEEVLTIEPPPSCPCITRLAAWLT